MGDLLLARSFLHFDPLGNHSVNYGYLGANFEVLIGESLPLGAVDLRVEEMDGMRVARLTLARRKQDEATTASVSPWFLLATQKIPRGCPESRAGLADLRTGRRLCSGRRPFQTRRTPENSSAPISATPGKS